ncbi:hypothetical protein ACFE04_026809 [Oxalis oulophora]
MSNAIPFHTQVSEADIAFCRVENLVSAHTQNNKTQLKTEGKNYGPIRNNIDHISADNTKQQPGKSVLASLPRCVLNISLIMSLLFSLFLPFSRVRISHQWGSQIVAFNLYFSN